MWSFIYSCSIRLLFIYYLWFRWMWVATSGTVVRWDGFRGMLTLDNDIRNILEAVIENDLAAPKVPRERVPKLRRIWKCQQAHDFLYGHRVGYYKGLAEGIILERYRRQLSDEEEDAIFKIVQLYTKGLRKYFSYYKDKRTRTKN